MPNLVERLLARRGSVAREQKQSAVAPLVALQGLGRPQWSERSSEALTREGFRRNAIVYRCVRLVAEAAASVKIDAFAGKTEVELHPLAQLLARPNPREAGPDLFESLYGHLVIAGNAYLELVTGEAEPGRLMPRELYSLRPDRMRVLPGPDGWPEAYEYAVGRMSQRLPADGERPSVLHLRFFDPLDDHYGMAPLAAAQVALDIHNAASAWNKALLDNAARPSGALVYAAGGANLSDEQFERLKRELETAFQGPSNAGRPLLLEGGLDWKPLSMSPKDMDFLNARAAAAREIALAFGVPPLLLGLPGDNTYANYAEANRAFWRQTVLPLVSRTLAAISHWLSPFYGDQLRLEPDIDSIDALSDRSLLWRFVPRADFLTVNEKRRMLGFDVLNPEELSALARSAAPPMAASAPEDGQAVTDVPVSSGDPPLDIEPDAAGRA